MTTQTATYSPEDNKLRLYVGRVPRDEYEKLRRDGWTSTPKQGCDFVAVWTPSRHATALEYAEGVIEDEDQGPERPVIVPAAPAGELFALQNRMKTSGFHRLHALRMENDAAGFQMDEERPRFEQLAHRHENGTAPRAVSAYQLFQTPPDLAARLAALLDLAPGARVLEPSAGLGRLLDALAPYVPAEVVAVELAPACAGELFKQERDGVKIRQRDFLDMTPSDLGFFDRVAMNPPFHMRSDIRHIEHALNFVRPGGTLAALCLDTEHRERALRHRAATWQKIPAGAFKSEGTQVPTVLLTIRA